MCDSPPNSTDVLAVSTINPKNALHLQASKSSAGERDTVPTRNAIMEDRKHEVRRHSMLRKVNDRCVCQIDAAIVRIMKARKELPVCTA